MKILKLTLLNINSLKGKFEIDFKKLLQDNSLFAITGATGAGKSTILDVITCALYGRTHRLKNPNDLMSRHTGESLCEVEFEIKGKLYRSSWNQKRAFKKPDGKFQNAKMELYNITEEKLIATQKKVPAQIENLSGLDFDRFMQSMMLAQGSFDAFLKAKEADRSSLLEEITKTQIYNKISRKVHEKYIALKDEIKIEEEALENIELIDQEEKDNIKDEIKQLKSNKTMLEKEIIKQTKIEEYIKQKELLEQYKHKIDTISQIKKDFKDRFDRLELANRALNIESIYKEFEVLSQDYSSNQKKYSNLEIQNKKLDADIKIFTKDFEDIQTRFQNNTYNTQLDKINIYKTITQDIEQKEQKTSALIQTKQGIDSRLDTLNRYWQDNQHFTTLGEELPLLQQLILEYQQKQKELLEQNKQISSLEKMILDTKKLFQISQTDKDNIQKEYETNEQNLKNISIDTAYEKELQNQLTIYQKQLQKFQDLQDISAKLQNILESNKLDQIAQNRLNLEITDAKKLQDELKKHLITLQTKKEYEVLIAKYEDDRKKLKNGDRCFLCGSTEHPFVDNKIVQDPNDTDIKISKQNKEIEKIQDKIIQLNQNLTEIDTKIKINTTQAKQLELESIRIKEFFANYDLSNTTQDILEQKLHTITQELQYISNQKDEKERLLSIKDRLNTKLQKAKDDFAKYQKELSILDTKLSQSNEIREKIAILIQNLNDKISKQFQKYNIFNNIT